MSETISQNDQSRIQESVDVGQACATSNMTELNEDKCKEFDFLRGLSGNTFVHPIFINHKEIEVVDGQQILGHTVSNDFKWKYIWITWYQKQANVYSQ